MTRYFLIFLTCLMLSGCSTEDSLLIDPAVYPFSDKANEKGWVLRSDLSDEFTGTAIESSKWVTLYPGWNGRFPSWFCSSNVTIENHAANLTMRKEHLPEMEEGYQYTTGVIRSLSTFRYGYCEIKAQCMASAGSSAFYLNNVQADWWTEIDVFEIGGRAPGYEQVIHTNLHEFYHSENVKAPYVIDETTHTTDPFSRAMNWRPDAAFHVYGIEWDRNTIKWYVDGLMIRETPNTKWHQEQYINIDSETMPDWFGLPDEKDLPSTFVIDYVRTWQTQ